YVPTAFSPSYTNVGKQVGQVGQVGQVNDIERLKQVSHFARKWDRWDRRLLRRIFLEPADAT
ncbi:hypothetical protein O4J55_29445, partial [Paracoccus sp. PXZ]